MAFFQLVLKARKLEKARLSYEDEKLRSIEISKGAKPRYTFKQRIRLKKLWFKKKVKGLFGKIISISKDSWYYKKIVAVRSDGTLENYVAKSFFGFFGGIFLTYIFFAFFVLQLKFKLSSATMLCTVIGVILTLGLAFSLRVRCVVFLLLPQFFSKRGRQALIAYALILTLSGPVKNTLHNIAVLSESLTCAQEQLKEAVKSVVDLAKQPFYALREAISKVIKSVRAVVKRIKQSLIAIKRIVLSILSVIKSVFQWLGSIVNICNKKLGTPFDRCQNVFEGAVADCKAKLGPILGLVCNLTYIVGALCYIVKPLDFICMLVSYIADTVLGAVRRKVKKFTMHMRAMLYVKVKFSHSFHFETNQSKTLEEVSAGIVTEIRSRTDKFFGFFDWMSFVTSFFVFIIVLKVLRYRFKWMTSERFDNRYITKDLRKIDLIRARQDKETVLPLNRRERSRYAALSSVMLIKSEKTQLARSAVFLGLATIKMLAFMSIDYSLYWVLYTIQLHGRFQSKVDRPNVVSVHVSGDGYLADLYRSIVRAFTPHGEEAEIDTLLCLPEPVPPDLDKYTQIGALIILCWLVAIFEPYGLRLRHVVMCNYYPDRAKQRATWLYNHIIRSRGSFLKFARRQLRRKFGLADEGEKIEKVTLRERLWAMCPFLNVFFPLKQKMCLMCGAVERSEDDPLIKCPTPGCVGLFCSQCFAELQNLCTICRSPIDYGDLSDISEEKDSSDDQFPVVEKPEAESEVESEVELEAEPEVEPEVEPEEELEEELEVKPEEEPEMTEEEPKVQEEEEEKVPLIDEKEEEEIEEEEEKKPEDVEKVEKLEKDVAEQTDERYVEDPYEISSESGYSYTYQEESPREVEVEKRREPFRDVEAQKIRDDVTIQIFNEPFVREPSTSSCASPTSCFVVRARRKVRAKLKKPPGGDSDSSSSIADTESWSTDEVDEEEVMHIEVGDSEELLPKYRRDKKKRGRINKIVSAVARIPWIGRGEADGKTCPGLQTKRPSLMNKIVSMLQRKQSLPVQLYRRTRKTKVTSSSSSCDDECRELLEMQDRSTGSRYLKRRRTGKGTMEDEDDAENLNLKRAREKKFTTKEIPRYLQSAVKGTCYYEVDETEDSRTARKCVRQVEDVNELSGVRVSSDSGKRDTWNITGDDEFVGPCSCTSGITYDTPGYIHSLGMCTISEHTDGTSITGTGTETEDVSTVSDSDTEYTDQTESSSNVLEVQDTKGTCVTSEYEGPRHLKESKREAREARGSVKKQSRIRGGSTKGDVRTSTVSKETEEVSAPKEEDATKAVSQGETVEVSTDADASPVLDPLIGSETSAGGHKPNKGNKVEEADDTNKKVIADSTATVSKIDKATDLPDKSKYTQTKFHKRDSKGKRKSVVQDSEAQDVKDSGERLKEISKVSEEKKKRSEKKEHRKKRYKVNDRIKISKSGKCICSEESTWTEEEEYYGAKKKKEEHKRRSKLLFEDAASAERCHKYSQYDQHPVQDRPCPCHPQSYETNFRRRSSSEPRGDHRGFEMPVVKKYLPMYQSPELIEELKRHDRMKLIREREARGRRAAGSPRSPDSISVSSTKGHQRTDRIVVCHPPKPTRFVAEDDRLPYQETQAYKKVLREFQTRSVPQESPWRSEDSVPLIRLSKKADKTKEVKQLYPPQNRDRGRSDAIKKFTNKIITSFKPKLCKKHKRKSRTQNLTFEEMDTTCCDHLFDPEVLSDVSSACKCSKKRRKPGASNSTDETTDNNESIQ